MKDIFTDRMRGRPAVHIATDSVVIIKNVEWYRGQLSYDVAVPQEDKKGKPIFCDATYSQNEIKIL